jgi:hypothetical protein
MSAARSLLILAVLTLGGATGCQATYTSVRRGDDSAYYVTRLKQSPFSAWGTLFRCEASKSATELRCRTIAEP